MEKRSAERYFIDLPADASTCLPPTAESSSRVQIRDISTAGVTFYDDRPWSVGEKIFMAIHIGDGIVGPFSYSLKTQGHVVRKVFEENQGESIFAVAFDEGIRIAGWMELESSPEGKSGQQ